jgi:hypothetical protein
MLLVVPPLLHKNEPPPPAVNKTLSPLQTVSGEAEIVATGGAAIFTVNEAVNTPQALVTETLYTVCTLGVTLIEEVVFELLQRYVLPLPAPVTFRVSVVPAQTESPPLIAIVGEGVTVIFSVRVVSAHLPDTTTV